MDQRVNGIASGPENETGTRSHDAEPEVDDGPAEIEEPTAPTAPAVGGRLSTMVRRAVARFRKKT